MTRRRSVLALGLAVSLAAGCTAGDFTDAELRERAPAPHPGPGLDAIRDARLHLGLGLAGKSVAPDRSVAPADEETTPHDGHARLVGETSPTDYQLYLDIDPGAEHFAGAAIISVEVNRETSALHLHAEDLVIRRVYALDGDEGSSWTGARRRAWTVEGENGGLTVRVDPPLPAGKAKLGFVYTGEIAESTQGLFRTRHDGKSFAFTQLQPFHARRVFPSFDQPDLKARFQVTLRAPTGLGAYSSAPEVARTPDELAGFDVVEFAPTEPIPTYLLAIAVGDLVAVPVREGGKGSPPIRLIVPRGTEGQTAFAARQTPPLLDWLTEYFGRPYPFQKLDLVAVPGLGVGAMENVGLVTFRDALLLFSEDPPPVGARTWSQVTIAHELAHMWFGDLVTPAWWDELWLNESFATWLSYEAVDAVDPALEVDVEAASHAFWAMWLDSKRDAKAVRQPVETAGDVLNAFGGITYSKGAAVLRMLESWLGPEEFRRGIRSYVDANAYGTGTTDGLLRALEEATGRSVGKVARSFLDRPGTPLVEARLECRGGPDDLHAGATLHLSQERYVPMGREPGKGPPWAIPLRIRREIAPPAGLASTRSGATFGRIEERSLALLQNEQTFELAGACGGDFLHPNSGERGYVRWVLPPAQLRAMVEAGEGRLSLVERMALGHHLGALLEADRLPVGDYVEAMEALTGDEHAKVLQGPAGALWTLESIARGEAPLTAGDTAAAADDDDLREQVARLASLWMRPHLDRVGFDPLPGEPPDRARVRREAVSTLGWIAHDPQVIAHARAVTERYLAGPAPASRDEVNLYLGVAARHGDEALWTRLVEALPRARDPGERGVIVGALGTFPDPALVRRSLDLMLDGTLRPVELGRVSGASLPETRHAVFDWVREHHAFLAEGLGAMGLPHLPHVAGAFCSAAEADEARAHFEPLAPEIPGLAHQLSLTLESVQRCAAMRAAYREPLRQHLGWRADLDGGPAVAATPAD